MLNSHGVFGRIRFEDSGAIGWLIVGVILGIVFVIWLIAKIIGGIF